MHGQNLMQNTQIEKDIFYAEGISYFVCQFFCARGVGEEALKALSHLSPYLCSIHGREEGCIMWDSIMSITGGYLRKKKEQKISNVLTTKWRGRGWWGGVVLW